jgi:Na+-translocating ferredoxin:NAD+ oxidoreductase RnfA subunit
MKLSGRLVDISIIIVFFVFLELIFRTASPLISGNIKQIYEIPSIATELAKKNNAILFLGNSLLGNALDLTEFDKQANLNMSSYKVVPDGTSLWDWSCIIKNNFINKEQLPKVVVIGYAWEQVKPVPSRLGGFFCSIRDLPNLTSLGMNSSSDVLDFLFSKVFRLYAMRETLRKRILDILIPDYRVQTQNINTERNQNKPLKYKKNIPENYQLLNAYLKMLVTNNIKPVIVAMPVMQHYELDKEFFKAVTHNGGIVLDYRELDGIENSMFRDPIHLNEQGNKVFTYHLAADLKDI